MILGRKGSLIIGEIDNIVLDGRQYTANEIRMALSQWHGGVQHFKARSNLDPRLHPFASDDLNDELKCVICGQTEEEHEHGIS